MIANSWFYFIGYIPLFILSLTVLCTIAKNTYLALEDGSPIFEQNFLHFTYKKIFFPLLSKYTGLLPSMEKPFQVISTIN